MTYAPTQQTFPMSSCQQNSTNLQNLLPRTFMRYGLRVVSLKDGHTDLYAMTRRKRHHVLCRMKSFPRLRKRMTVTPRSIRLNTLYR